MDVDEITKVGLRTKGRGGYNVIKIMIPFSYFCDVNMRALWSQNGMMLGLEGCNCKAKKITLFLGKNNQ
jgi:hypothetical protein